MIDSHDNLDPAPASRTSIDRAVGALMALRGYTPEQAFEELVAHSYRCDVSLLQSARSLVAAAREVAVDSASSVGAQKEWGDVIAVRQAPVRIDNVA